MKKPKQFNDQQLDSIRSVLINNINDKKDDVAEKKPKSILKTDDHANKVLDKKIKKKDKLKLKKLTWKKSKILFGHDSEHKQCIH